MLQLLSILVLAALQGCATVSQPSAYERALDQAFGELGQRSVRRPAQAASRLDQFRKLRGRTEMLVFPVVSNQNAKLADEPIRAFGAPLRFAITSQRLLDCQKLLLEKSDQWSHREHFSNVVGMDCAILEIKQVSPELKAANRKIGDPLSARLYLDSQYHAHGLDVELHRSRKSSTISRLKLDPSEASSSGMMLFPTDIPNLDLAAAQAGALPQAGDPYVAAQAVKLGAATCAQASVSRHRDLYGSWVDVGWCEGDAWPTVIKNNRFFAVLVRK